MAKAQGLLQDVITGLFVAAVIALLAFFTIVISGVDWLYGSNTVERVVQFESIGALKVQDPVYVRGMKVGSVQELKLGKGHVAVTLRLNSEVALHEDCAVSIHPTSLLGGSCVQIAEGAQGEPLPQDQVIQGITPTDMVQELGELVTDLRRAFDPEDLRATLANVRTASADVAVLTERIRKGEGFIGKLLDPNEGAYDDLSQGLSNLRKLTDDLHAGKGLLGKLLREDDTTYADLQATVANLNEVTSGLRDGKGLLGKLLREDDTAYADLTETLANVKALTQRLNDPENGFGRLFAQDSTLVRDLEATATNLKDVTAKLNEGQGTLGRLINDDAIATEVEATIKDVRQIIDNMRDTAPITTFSSLFFGGL